MAMAPIAVAPRAMAPTEIARTAVLLGIGAGAAVFGCVMASFPVIDRLPLRMQPRRLFSCPRQIL